MSLISSSLAAQKPIQVPEESAFAQASADFDMFLTLLTTQMQNQDPLDPMDSSEYTQQLVQYSQVEQSIQQTEALREISSKLTALDLMEASGLIGREVQFDSRLSTLSDKPAAWGWSADRPLQQLTATISDSNGRIIDRRSLEVNDDKGRFLWDGSKADGSKAAEGVYTVAFTGVDADGRTAQLTVNSIGRIREAAVDGNSIKLDVDGIRFAVADLISVSAPST